MAKQATGNGPAVVTQVTYLDFVKKAIKAVTATNGGKSKGIHSVYSGFNSSFREYYGGNADPVKAVTDMVAAGRLATRPVRGGVMIYLPEDAPTKQAADKGLLKAMGLGK